MNILAFDTCLDKMYVVLGKDNTIIDSKIIETTKEHYHSAYLISTIREILLNNNIKPNEVDVIATNIGPGSFTGIRACTTVARIFAQGTNAKTVGISSLEILSRINSSDKKTIVALDARKSMAYVAIYNNHNEIFTPKAILISELKEILKKDEYYLITDLKLKEELGGIAYQENDSNLGKYLLELAFEKHNSIDTDWKKLHPLYIQPPPVTVKKISK